MTQGCRARRGESGYRRTTAIAFTLGLAFWAAGCVREQVGPTYRIGLGPWVGFGPLYLAQEKGLFEKAGLDIDLIVLTGLAERNSALRSGHIDALAAPVDYFV